MKNTIAAQVNRDLAKRGDTRIVFYTDKGEPGTAADHSCRWEVLDVLLGGQLIVRVSAISPTASPYETTMTQEEWRRG
jgi:hypothetical protein